MDKTHLVFITSEDIVESIQDYIEKYPKPYAPLNLVLASMIEELVNSDIGYDQRQVNLEIVAERVNSWIIESLEDDVNCAFDNSLDFDDGEETKEYERLNKLYDEIMNDNKLIIKLLFIATAIYDELCDLKIINDKAKATINCGVNTKFNQLGIITKITYDS